MLNCILLATLAFASTAPGAAAPSAASAAIDLFTVSGISVDMVGASPRAAHDLAMAQARPLAWSKLFRRFAGEDEWVNQPQLSDNQIMSFIGSVEVGDERRSTKRYLANLVFHFNPVAVRQLLLRSNIAFTEGPSEPTVVIPLTDAQVLYVTTDEKRQAIDRRPIANEPGRSIVDEGVHTHLTAIVRFDTMKDWARLHARLEAMKTVTETDVVGLALHEAEIDITYSGQIEQLRVALAQQRLELGKSEGQYTLELANATAASSP